MQESAKSVKSVNANFLHFTNSCLSSTRGKYLGCFIHKFLSHCVLSHRGTNYIKKSYKKLIFKQKMIRIHLYKVDCL